MLSEYEITTYYYRNQQSLLNLRLRESSIAEDCWTGRTWSWRLSQVLWISLAKVAFPVLPSEDKSPDCDPPSLTRPAGAEPMQLKTN